MAICVAVDAGGFIRQTNESVEACSNLVLMDYAQYNILAEPLLDPVDIAYVFAWGFGAVVVLGYFGGYAIGIAKRLIKLA